MFRQMRFSFCLLEDKMIMLLLYEQTLVKSSISCIVIVVLIEHIMENGQHDTLKKFENLLLIFEFLMWCWSFWLFYDSSNKYAFWFSTAY